MSRRRWTYAGCLPCSGCSSGTGCTSALHRRQADIDRGPWPTWRVQDAALRETLSETDLDMLGESGYVRGGPLLPADLLDKARQRIAELLAGRVRSPVGWQQESDVGGVRVWAGPSVPYRQIHEAWPDDVQDRLFCHPVVGALLSPLLGEKVVLQINTARIIARQSTARRVIN